jgi:hypothetical protein
MKPIGSDGRPIPTPPDERTGGEILAGYVRQGLFLLALLLGFGGLLIVLSQPPFTKFGWNAVAQKLALMPIMITILIVGFGVVGTILNYATWPFRRKDAGRTYERRIARMSPDQVADEIARSRAVLAELREPRKRRSWERWLNWLERQPNVRPEARTSLVAGTYHPTLAARVWAGIWAAGALIGGGWMFLNRPDWASGILFGVVALVFNWVFVKNITERLELTVDSLTYYAYGRRRWSAPREHIATREEGVGSSSYDLYDARTGRMLDRIEGSTFGVDTVEALADLFPPWLKEEAG